MKLSYEKQRSGISWVWEMNFLSVELVLEKISAFDCTLQSDISQLIVKTARIFGYERTGFKLAHFACKMDWENGGGLRSIGDMDS